MISRLLCGALAALVLALGTADAQLMTLGAGKGAPGSACADANWSSVVLLIGNDSAGNGSTTFTDQSASGHTQTTGGAGSVQYSSTQAPSGLSTSIRFVSSAVLKASNSADFQLGSGNFTIEAWIYVPNPNNATNQDIITTSQGGGPEALAVDVGSGTDWWGSGTLGWDVFTANNGGGAGLSSNTWTHTAFYRIGNAWYHAWNGTVTTVRASDSTSLYATTQPLCLGNTCDGSSLLVTGTSYMASIRVTKGVARYNPAGFTPPSLPLPSC